MTRVYLVARADGTVRAVKRLPALGLDEVAFPVNIHMPEGWGEVARQAIDLTMPPPPAAEATGEGLRGE